MKGEPDSRATPAGWTFFRQWLKNPREVAAISPSSRQLARQMVHQLPRACRRVIELGGGTGALTRAVLHHGIRPEDLLVLELNEELHQHLQREFPGVRVVCADAMCVREVARQHGFVGEDGADAVVSGLGLLAMAREAQQQLLAAAFDALRREGRFVQFTYGPANPVAREVLDELDLTSRRASFTWWNVPPATVYVYQRRVSRKLSARRMR